jgi:hypothetical protein
MPKAYPLFNPQVKTVFGGAEVDLYLLATELAKDSGFAVSFITADYGQPEIELFATEDIENTEKNQLINHGLTRINTDFKTGNQQSAASNKISIIRSLNLKENALRGAYKLVKAMKKADADIYLQKSASWGTFLAAMFCKLHKRAFLYRTATAGECDGNWPKGGLERRAFHWSLRQAGEVLVQNETDQRNIHDLLDVHALLMRNGHRIMPLTHDERNGILWVGRSDKIKRPELFIDLAEKMPGEKFTMICQRATGDNEYDTLTARARQVKNLEFIERVPFAEIDGFFQRAKVFVNTSDTEGFPNTFIQACKYAVPIVSLNVNPDDFLERYNCGIACGGDLVKCADALKYMLAENRYVELGKNARKYVEQKHDLKIIIEEYKRLFNALQQRRRQKCAE